MPQESASLIQEAYERCRLLRLDELEAEGLYHSDQLFFPVITYPPPVGLPPLEDDALFIDRDRFDEARQTLYVHLPFCLTRCVFCHWVVTLGSDEERIDRYLKALDREFTMFIERLGRGRLRPRSVLIGGGTPTYLGAPQLSAFFDVLRKHVDLSQCRQFSMEAEPSTLLGPEGDGRLVVMRDFGVGRVSMGVQAFDDEILKSQGRVHDSAVALRSIERLRDFDIPSVSIDLIYGLPNQSLESWISTMRTCVSSGADAWQLYRLRILPHGDRPGRIIDQYKRQPDRFPNVSDVHVMKMIGWLLSEAGGFPQHYTRIFARDPQHISYYLNDVNFELYDVTGIGISSWSSVGRTFAQNCGNDFKRYYERVENGRLPHDHGLRRDDDDELRRSVILPLKNAYLDLARFEQRFGVPPSETAVGPGLARLSEMGLLEEDDGRLRMTQRGRFVADETVMQLFPDKYLPRRELAVVRSD